MSGWGPGTAWTLPSPWHPARGCGGTRVGRGPGTASLGAGPPGAPGAAEPRAQGAEGKPRRRQLRPEGTYDAAGRPQRCDPATPPLSGSRTPANWRPEGPRRPAARPRRCCCRRCCCCSRPRRGDAQVGAWPRAPPDSGPGRGPVESVPPAGFCAPARGFCAPARGVLPSRPRVLLFREPSGRRGVCAGSPREKLTAVTPGLGSGSSLHDAPFHTFSGGGCRRVEEACAVTTAHKLQSEMVTARNARARPPRPCRCRRTARFGPGPAGPVRLNRELPGARGGLRFMSPQ